MLSSLPEETTQLLIDICTSLVPLTFDDNEERSTPTRQASTNGPSYLSYLALNRSSTPAQASEHPPPSSASTMTARPAVVTGRESVPETSRSSTPPPSTPTASSIARTRSVKRPSPRLYFAHFIDHRDYFVRFLEAVALKRWGQSVDISTTPDQAEVDPNTDEEAEKRDQTAVWNTLLELYLGQDQEEGVEKALRVLESKGIPYDPTHALILCSTRSVAPGLVLLWERAGMHEDIVRHWMDAHRSGDPMASAEVVKALDKYGSEHPGLYPLVLRFLTSSNELLNRHTVDLQRVLKVVEENNIMQPLSVVQVLSRNGVTTVGLVKEWLMTRIRQAQEEVRTVSIPGASDEACLHVECRTNNSSILIALRPKLNYGRSKNFPTLTILACSM